VNSAAEPYVFHITPRRAFSAALDEGAYEASSLASEGFIHCSTREQVLRTASRLFAGQAGLVLLCIEAAKLGEALRYEPADGELFPHCYGKLPLDAIPAVIEFPCRKDGTFELPAELEAFES
jgi:uncharacterized protein (DUF952 family)